MIMKRLKISATAMLLGLSINHSANAAPVDITFIVDQSLSMPQEFTWIPNVITQIDTALQAESAVTSTRYGFAGYMEGVGNEFGGPVTTPNRRDDELHELAFVDMTSDITAISTAATNAAADLRRFTERGYHAADWSRTGFDWDDAAVKIMILITDEAGDQGSIIPNVGPGTKEQDLGQLLDDGGFLLNVITSTNLYRWWDDAVFDINDPTYTGLFDLNFLRTNPTLFTQQFVDAKVVEITSQIPVPGTLALIAIGIAGFGRLRNRM